MSAFKCYFAYDPCSLCHGARTTDPHAHLQRCTLSPDQRGVYELESIGFVTAKYPEYFKSKDTTIHDTTIIERLVEVQTIDTTVILSDSSDFYHYMSDSLSLLVNKLTGSVKIKIKQKRVYIHDTITISVPCPQVICPDCDDLKDNTKDGPGFKWWWLILIGVVLAAFYIWVNRNVNN